MEQTRKKLTDSNYQEQSKRKDKHRPSRRFHQTTDWYHCQPVSEFSARQWNSQGQRLYPTMSDSAVCGYSFPYECSVNSGFPVYPVLSTSMYPVGLENVRRPTRLRKKSHKYLDIESGINNNSNFTSLPPVNIGNVNCSEKRRFSDPGLNNVDESNESSSSDSGSDAGSVANELLLEQILELKSENQRLFNELDSTKNELITVKSELTLVSSKVTCHEPLSLAQMVREIRDAAEVREKVLLSKLEILIDNCLNSKNMDNIINEIDSLKKRLSQLESQVDHIRIQNKIDSKINGEATFEEIDDAAKRKNDAAEIMRKSHTNKKNTKEEDDTYLTTKTSENVESTSDCNGNSLSTISCESLSSSLGPGSLHSATLTVCGPVTDL